jgi:hypothetical protein
MGTEAQPESSAADSRAALIIICLNIVFVFSGLTGFKGSHEALWLGNHSNCRWCDGIQYSGN